MILPGGKIFLTKGFLKQTESENELSFVLCHELGHFYHRHTMAGLTQQLFLGVFQMVLGHSGGISGGLNGITQIFVHSGFSRSQETQADEFALSCLNNKYGHVNGHSHFFEKNKKNEFKGTNKYFSSHPMSEDRILNLKQKLAINKLNNEGALTKFKYSPEK